MSESTWTLLDDLSTWIIVGLLAAMLFGALKGKRDD